MERQRLALLPPLGPGAIPPLQDQQRRTVHKGRSGEVPGPKVRDRLFVALFEVTKHFLLHPRETSPNLGPMRYLTPRGYRRRYADVLRDRREEAFREVVKEGATVRIVEEGLQKQKPWRQKSSVFSRPERRKRNDLKFSAFTPS